MMAEGLTPPSVEWLRTARSRLLAAAVLLAAFPAGGPLRGQTQTPGKPEIQSLRVGLDGRYKTGHWAQVEIGVRAGQQAFTGRLVVGVPDGDGVASRFISPSFRLAVGQSKRIAMPVKFGRRAGDLRAQLEINGQVAAQRGFTAGTDFPLGLASAQRLIVALGPQVGVEQAAASNAPEGSLSVTVVNLAAADQLPLHPLGYDGVEALVIADAWQAAGARGSQRLHALNEWLTQGGRLFLVATPPARQSLATGGALADYLPGRLGPMTRLTRTSALETHIGSTYQVPGSRQAGSKGQINVPRLEEQRGTVVLGEPSLPLVISTPWSFGEVTAVLLDLSAGSLAQWQGRGAFMGRLLWPNQTSTGGGRGPATYLGLTDLAGQLRGALDQFTGVRVVPFWAVALSAAAYVILIGPVDYLLLRRLGRMEWTWFTFPLIAAFFGLAAWLLAERWKGDAIRLNQVDLVDVDVATGQVRGTTWFNVFSPRQTAYDVAVQPAAPWSSEGQEQIVVAWHGLPGAALGGMEQENAPESAIHRPYWFSSDRERLLAVPVGIWSTKSFIARWHKSMRPLMQAKLTANLDLVAEGTITSRLPMALEDCMLVSGQWAYLLGELRPGVPARIAAGDQRDLEPVLKQYKLVREEKGNVLQVATPYDQAGYDVPSILRQMMFYEAGRARSYTGLSHRYQDFTDLSEHLNLGSAILVGRARSPASRIELDGKQIASPANGRWSMYRFLLPMESKPTMWDTQP